MKGRNRIYGKQEGIMKKRRICSYCGRRIEGMEAEYRGSRKDNQEELYCSPECRKRHEAALGNIRRNLKWFAAGITLSVLLILCSAFAGTSENGTGSLLGGSGMLLLGFTLLLFPYCTPETYAMLGYVNTTRLGRGMGILIMLFGFWMFF